MITRKSTIPGKPLNIRAFRFAFLYFAVPASPFPFTCFFIILFSYVFPFSFYFPCHNVIFIFLYSFILFLLKHTFLSFGIFHIPYFFCITLLNLFSSFHFQFHMNSHMRRGKIIHVFRTFYIPISMLGFSFIVDNIISICQMWRYREIMGMTCS